MTENLYLLSESELKLMIDKAHHKGWIEGKNQLKEYLKEEIKWIKKTN